LKNNNPIKKERKNGGILITCQRARLTISERPPI